MTTATGRISRNLGSPDTMVYYDAKNIDEEKQSSSSVLCFLFRGLAGSWMKSTAPSVKHGGAIIKSWGSIVEEKTRLFCSKLPFFIPQWYVHNH